MSKAVRESLVMASDPATVGKTWSLVQAPHRSLKPGQRTDGLRQGGETRIELTRIGLELKTVRPTA